MKLNIIDKWELIILFCIHLYVLISIKSFEKKTIKRVEGKPQIGRRSLQPILLAKGFIFRLCKELLQFIFLKKDR